MLLLIFVSNLPFIPAEDRLQYEGPLTVEECLEAINGMENGKRLPLCVQCGKVRPSDSERHVVAISGTMKAARQLVVQLEEVKEGVRGFYQKQAS